MPRVLIVDNEGPVRIMLAEVLRASGYDVSAARSGFEALALASSVEPDLIMLDVNMPGFDGWATLEHLRAAHPAAKVLMMSGADHAAQALAWGAAPSSTSRTDPRTCSGRWRRRSVTSPGVSPAAPPDRGPTRQSVLEAPSRRDV